MAQGVHDALGLDSSQGRGDQRQWSELESNKYPGIDRGQLARKTSETLWLIGAHSKLSCASCGEEINPDWPKYVRIYPRA